MKSIMISFVFLCSSSLFAATAEAATNTTSNLDKGIILKGYDVVSYFKGPKPLKGQAAFKTEVDGATYFFANAENQQEFIKNPKKYAPAYEGWCATAVAEGYKYDIDPENYLVTDGRLFLFYKGWKGDARKPWLKDPANNTKKADGNWPKVKTTKE